MGCQMEAAKVIVNRSSEREVGMVVWMYDGWFVSLLRHRLQICSNGGTTAATSGLVRCKAVLHGYGTSPVACPIT